MAKLTAKQRKAMPASEFGIPETKAFPLHDKSHVASAIRFFKHAPEDKKKSLAQKINRKAKEYGMKISTNGEFAKYLAHEATAFYNDPGKITINEASNFGTLSPIVGGVAEDFDEDKLDSAAYSLLHLDEITKENFEGNESLPKTQFVVKESMILYVEKPYIESQEDLYHNTYNVFNSMLKSAYLRAEYNSMKNYILNERDSEIIDKVRGELDTNTPDKIRLFRILIQAPTINEIRPALYQIYCRDRKLCFDLIKAMVDFRERQFSMFQIGYFKGMVHSILDNTNSLNNPYFRENKTMEGFTPEELRKHMTYVEEYRHEIESKLLPKLNEYLNGRVQTRKPIDIVPAFYISNKIDGYAIIPGEEFFLVKPKNSKIVRIAKVDQHALGGNPQLIMIQFDEYFLKNLYNTSKDDIPVSIVYLFEPEQVAKEAAEFNITQESVVGKLKRMTSEFMDSLHVDSEGDVKFMIKDKITFEHYEEVHKLFRACVEAKNYTEMKENLAYVFAIINMIEDDPVYKSHNTSSQEYRDLIRLRALFISDFKVHHRIIMKHDPNFNFTKYYETSKANTHLYTIKKKHIKNAVALFKALV